MDPEERTEILHEWRLPFWTARHTIDFNLINTYYVFNTTRSVLEVDLNHCVTDLRERKPMHCQ
jgi:activator of HSP90 ATPase